MNPMFSSGTWHSVYSYQPGDSTEPVTSEHTIVFEESEDKPGEVIGISTPQADGSAVQLVLRYDPDSQTLTGTWHETTSSTGPYQGRTFHGALQLLVDESSTSAHGVWVGFNGDKTAIKIGNWSLQKQKLASVG